MFRAKFVWRYLFVVFCLFSTPVYGQEANSHPVLVLSQDSETAKDSDTGEKKAALMEYITGIESVKTVDQLMHFIQLLEEIKIHYVDDKSSDDLIDLAMRGMVEGLDHNSHLFLGSDVQSIKDRLSGEDIYQGGIGVSIISLNKNIFITEVFEGGPAFKAGLEPGDMILKVGANSTFGLTTDATSSLIRGEDGTFVTLETRSVRSQKPRLVTLVRQRIVIKSVTYQNIGRDLAYIKVRQFTEETPDRFLEALGSSKGKKGLIIDLRGNPGGRLDVVGQMLQYMLGLDEEILSIKERYNETIFTTSSFLDQIYLGPPLPVNYPTNVVVLINNFSASASEIMSGDLQYYKIATLVGIRTFGKSTVQNYFGLNINVDSESHDLDNAEIIMGLTVGRYFLPNGHDVSSNGIVPDIEVEQPDDFKLFEFGTKRDLQLQRAIKILRDKK